MADIGAVTYHAIRHTRGILCACKAGIWLYLGWGRLGKRSQLSLDREMTAQIDLSYAFMLDNLVWRAMHHQPAIMDDIGMFNNAQHFPDIVIGN